MKYFSPGLMPMAFVAFMVALACVIFVITSGRMA